jgi:hypothetical protein
MSAVLPMLELEAKVEESMDIIRSQLMKRLFCVVPHGERTRLVTLSLTTPV